MFIYTRANCFTLLSPSKAGVRFVLAFSIFKILIGSTMMENCQCTRTWVLVVHNSFKGIVNDERFGNEIDVNNLRRAFSTQRQCRFAELADCCSADILRTLSNKQLFVQLFHPGNDCELKN